MTLHLYLGRRDEMERHMEANDLDPRKCRHIQQPDQLYAFGVGYPVQVHVALESPLDLITAARLRFTEANVNPI